MSTLVEVWGPVLETLNIKTNLEQISQFCNNVTIRNNLDNIHSDNNLNNISYTYSSNILALSVKLLSMLNLENKTIELSEQTENIELTFDVVEQDHLIKGENFENIIDYTVLTLCKNYIEEKLKNNNTLILKNLIDFISIIGEAGFKPKGIVRLSIAFK